MYHGARSSGLCYFMFYIPVSIYVRIYVRLVMRWFSIFTPFVFLRNKQISNPELNFTEAKQSL